MTSMADDYPFLSRKDLTAKDKLVLLAQEVTGQNAQGLSDLLGVPRNSVRQSLDKGLAPEELAEQQQTAEQAITEALLEVCHYDRNSMRQKDWSHIAKVAADLREAGATGEDVRQRARMLRTRMQMACTPGALEKYWASLAVGSPFSPGQVFD